LTFKTDEQNSHVNPFTLYMFIKTSCHMF